MHDAAEYGVVCLLLLLLPICLINVRTCKLEA